jgi:hypothetical protein
VENIVDLVICDLGLVGDCGLRIADSSTNLKSKIDNQQPINNHKSGNQQ